REDVNSFFKPMTRSGRNNKTSSSPSAATPASLAEGKPSEAGIIISASAANTARSLASILMVKHRDRWNASSTPTTPPFPNRRPVAAIVQRHAIRGDNNHRRSAQSPLRKGQRR